MRVTVTLNADVLIGALDRDEAHHDRARDLLTALRQREDRPLVSLVNLTDQRVLRAATSEQIPLVVG